MNTQPPNLNTDKYRLMVYFAHSTLVIYSKSIISNEYMSVHEFKDQNAKVCERVAIEAMNIFNYELSNEQMSRAAYAYLLSFYHSKSVEETEPYSLPDNEIY